MTTQLLNSQVSVVFAGFGGQGVMFAGQLLCYAAMNENHNVTWIPSYGPEMRGGTANCFVIISDREIGAPLVRQPNVAVVLNTPSFEKFAPQVAPGGLLISNSSLVNEHCKRSDIQCFEIPATDTASNLGNLQLANMVLLGALLAARPILSLEAVKRALDAHVSAHHRELLSLNYQALEQGATFVTGQPA